LSKVEKEKDSYKIQIESLTNQSEALKTKLSMSEQESLEIKSSCASVLQNID